MVSRSYGCGAPYHNEYSSRSLLLDSLNSFWRIFGVWYLPLDFESARVMDYALFLVRDVIALAVSWSSAPSSWCRAAPTFQEDVGA